MKFDIYFTRYTQKLIHYSHRKMAILFTRLDTELRSKPILYINAGFVT